MQLFRYILVLYFILTVASSVMATDDNLLALFQTNMNQRARNFDIDHVVSVKLITFAGLAEAEDVTYAYECLKETGRLPIHWSNYGLPRPPPKIPEMAAKRLDYLSLWLATVKPEETFKGKELKDTAVIIGKETGALDSTEIPNYLFYRMLEYNQSVVFGLKKVSADIVRKAISNLVVWRKDKQVFYQEAISKKDDQGTSNLWQNISTLKLPEDGPYYVIVDVGVGEKGKNKILNRYKKECEFQERMKELEAGEKQKQDLKEAQGIRVTPSTSDK